jgi:hypothetical protein
MQEQAKVQDFLWASFRAHSQATHIHQLLEAVQTGAGDESLRLYHTFYSEMIDQRQFDKLRQTVTTNLKFPSIGYVFNEAYDLAKKSTISVS